MAEPLPVGEIDWSPYAAIVEKRWHHYRPRFEQFARGGWMSWNWAAFFCTLAWLRYRKLYAWTWGYFFASTPVFFVLMVIWAAGDACERALDPMPGNAPGVIALCFFMLGWVVPPMFADRIYYNHVRRSIVRSGARAGTSTLGLAGALVLQAFVLILAAASTASYADYIYRAMVSEGISLAEGAKAPIAEFLEQHKRLPTRIEDVVETTSGRYVSQLALESDGAIRATFGEKGRKLAGRSVAVVPAIKDGRIVEWVCRSDNLPDQCLPASCRR